MVTLIISVFITNKKLFVRNLLTITMPTILIAVITFVTMFGLNVKIWYYYIEASVAEVFFFIVMISCLVNIAKHVKEIRLKNIFIRLILPVVFGSIWYIFAVIYLSNKFKVAKDRDKYVIRIVYYPLIVEGSLILQDYCYRTFDGGSDTTVHGRAHFIFLSQVSFGILGRYMTTISGSLIDVTVFSLFHFFKDVLIHRLSWLQCYVAHKLKRFLGMREAEEEFNEWFYSSHFQDFRACVFNNEFVLEVASKYRHFRLYFHFLYHKR